MKGSRKWIGKAPFIGFFYPFPRTFHRSFFPFLRCKVPGSKWEFYHSFWQSWIPIRTNGKDVCLELVRSTLFESAPLQMHFRHNFSILLGNFAAGYEYFRRRYAILLVKANS